MLDQKLFHRAEEFMDGFHGLGTVIGGAGATKTVAVVGEAGRSSKLRLALANIFRALLVLHIVGGIVN